MDNDDYEEQSIIEHRIPGVVKWFNSDKGFGFISVRGKPDLFVHYSAIKMDGFKALTQGDEVVFDVAKGKKGLIAVNVEKQFVGSDGTERWR